MLTEDQLLPFNFRKGVDRMTEHKNTVQSPKDNYNYLIVGGGMVAGYAANGIREVDSEGTIGILSAEIDVPYERPALTKKLWTDDDFTQDEITIGAEETDADIILETSVASIDRENRQVELEDGTKVGYTKLLIATGGEPNKIDGPEDDRVLFFREWKDYRKLRELSGETKHVLIVGGGYIGAELASSLSQNDTEVSLVFPDNILGGSQFPEEIAKEYEQTYRDAGVHLYSGKKAESYHTNNGDLVLVLDDGTELNGDALVVGLGVTPRLNLAKEAGLEVNEGVIVDEHLRTEDSNIYVAGDIAEYPDPILGQNRIEHVDHARNSGKTVGKIMAGLDQPYDYTPYFYSVVFDISWKAIGQMDPSLHTFIDEVDGGKVVYYLKDEKPVGILAWNVEPDLDEIRSILKNPPSDTKVLRGAIQPKES